MPQTAPKESWWPTIGAIVLLIIILLLGIFSYQSFAHNKQLSNENFDLRSQLTQLNADKEALTMQSNDLTKQVGKMACDGVWTGEKCDPYPVTITTKVASGTSPFAAVFTIHAKGAAYTMDFGDGTSTPLAAASTCTPKDDGFCLITAQHTYRNTTEADATFDAKVMLNGATVATTPVIVRAKK
jgi:hypothetical protein